MVAEFRREYIVGLAKKGKELSIEEIASHFGVSRETVRRDVMALEATGELRRVHGGVVATAPEPEAPIGERIKVRLAEKRSIARAAARLLRPGQTLFLDAGSTVSALAEELASLSGLTVITNSFDVAMKLVATDARRHEVILLGGRPVADIGATYGEQTVAEIHRHHADVALLSPVSLHAVHGATSYEHREAEVARAMVACSKRRVMLADHGKLGQASRVGWCAVNDIDQIVTDGRARRMPALEALREGGCDILIA